VTRTAHIRIWIEDDSNVGNGPYPGARISMDYQTELDEKTVIEILHTILPAIPASKAEASAHKSDALDGLEAEFKRVVETGQVYSKITYIKAVRDVAHCSLTDAKKTVEAWERRYV
jgi:ribosomal protein L7/L12